MYICLDAQNKAESRPVFVLDTPDAHISTEVLVSTLSHYTQ